MDLYLLYRSSSGYGLFEVMGGFCNTVEFAERSASDLQQLRRLVKPIGFRPYGSSEDSLLQSKTVTEGSVPEKLRAFLYVNLPQSDYKLGTESELAHVLVQFPCYTDKLVDELLKSVSVHFDGLMNDNKESPIPFDLVNDILARLPSETLLRFSISSKSWQSVIRNPDIRAFPRPIFVTVRDRDLLVGLYTFKGNQVAGDSFLLEESGFRFKLDNKFCYSNLDYPELPTIQGTAYNFNLPFYPAIQHVHGLIIVDHDLSAKIYNPSTRLCLKVPTVSRIPYLFPFLGLGKIFLHYEPDSKQYSCLALKREEAGDLRFLEAYMIMIRIGNSPPWKRLRLPGGEIPWNGIPFATQAYLKSWLYIVNRVHVLRFSSLTETLERVCKVPANLVHPYFLFVYKGRLAITHLFMGLVDADNPPCLYTLNESVNEEEAEVWTRMEFVLGEDTKEILKLFEKRGITPEGDLVMVSPMFTQQNLIHYYNPETGNLTTKQAVVEDTLDENMLDEGDQRALLFMDHVPVFNGWLS